MNVRTFFRRLGGKRPEMSAGVGYSSLIYITILSLILSAPVFAQSNPPASTPVCIDINGMGQSCMYYETYTPQGVDTDTPFPTDTLTPPSPTITETITMTPTGTPIPFLDFGGDLYRNPGDPLKCSTSGAWAFPGRAVTASTKRIYSPQMKGRKLISAEWIITWDPNTGASPTGVGLFLMDDGPSNLQEIIRVQRTNYWSPFVDGGYVTQPFQNLLDTGTYKHLGQMTFGNGSEESCLIYSSTLYVLWKRL